MYTTNSSYGFGIKTGDIIIITNTGIPNATIGAGRAGKGSLCIDTTNGKLYINGGTKAVPAWKLVTSAA